MFKRPAFLLATLALVSVESSGQWLELSRVEVREEVAELAGPRVVITYELQGAEVNEARPAYVFVRCRTDSGRWIGPPSEFLRGNGIGIVTSPGPKEIIWWGVREAGVSRAEKANLRVRAMAMRRVPGGRFSPKSIPGQGRDESGPREIRNDLPDFYMASFETTTQMYADYLSEVGGERTWNDRMSNPDRCGIVRNEEGVYRVVPGRELHPVTYVSWYDAVDFLRWCGLKLPTEAQFEKALRGGLYLDGDRQRTLPNPLPDRLLPWGNESPDADGAHRCNFDGPADGFENTAPVGSFPEFSSPYGIADLVGNVAEWTLDWYSTSHHAGLDGFRVTRGGSWMAPAEACDAVSGATQLPSDESSIIGFRGVVEPAGSLP